MKQQYFLGGYTWNKDNKQNPTPNKPPCQLERFVNEGIWESGYGRFNHDRDIEREYKGQHVFTRIKIGDYFALKHFDRNTGIFKIPEIGIVSKVINDYTLKIDWVGISERQLSLRYTHALHQIKNKEHIAEIFELVMTISQNYTEEVSYEEGGKKSRIINIVERNSAARAKCLEIHGYKCKICGFDFEKTYGEVGKGIIHVHHTTKISEKTEKTAVNPEEDLIPVCPNCHTVIHSKEKMFSIEEMREILGTCEIRQDAKSPAEHT